MTKVIGLTGGIASGKSTVVDFLRSLHYQVIDADQVVHELQAVGGRLYQAILVEFGPTFFDANAALNRQKLGALIFSDQSAREKLAELQNAIIRQELYSKRADLLEKSEKDSIIFMDIPLLIEQNYDGFDEIWLIAVSEEIQVQRIIARDGLDEKAARARIAAQMPVSEKKKYATHIIDSTGTIEETREQVKKLLAGLADENEE